MFDVFILLALMSLPVTLIVGFILSSRADRRGEKALARFEASKPARKQQEARKEAQRQAIKKLFENGVQQIKERQAADTHNPSSLSA